MAKERTLTLRFFVDDNNHTRQVEITADMSKDGERSAMITDEAEIANVFVVMELLLAMLAGEMGVIVAPTSQDVNPN